jgi:hypothetical protein
MPVQRKSQLETTGALSITQHEAPHLPAQVSGQTARWFSGSGFELKRKKRP